MTAREDKAQSWTFWTTAIESTRRNLPRLNIVFFRTIELGTAVILHWNFLIYIEIGLCPGQPFYHTGTLAYVKTQR